MSKLKTSFNEFKNNLNDWLYDHNGVRVFFDYFWAIILSTLSAFIFAAGFNTFMDLGTLAGNGGSTFQKILAGGMSGISQVITIILQLFGWKTVENGGTLDERTAYAVLYFALNVPLIVLAWVGIGKRFTILTLFNVVETSVFIRLFTVQNFVLLEQIATVCVDNGGMLARAIFGGVCTGLSSALAYKGDFSAGGIDVIAYYIALKKRTLVGKYSLILNGITLACFVSLSIVYDGPSASVAAHYISGAFYTAIYLFVTKLVIDAINIRNKKVKVEVVTTNEELGAILIKTLPHAATMIKGLGVYSGKEKYMFVIVVSSYELTRLMKVVKREDPEAFVQVVPLIAVEGRFFTKPIK